MTSHRHLSGPRVDLRLGFASPDGSVRATSRCHSRQSPRPAVAACSNPTVPNFNALNGFPHTAAALQSEVTGAFDGVRTDIGNYNLFTDGMARNTAYFTASEQRFVSVVTGESFAGPGDVFMGPSVWDFYFNAVKGIDTIIGNISAIVVTTSSGSGPMPAAQQESLFGAMETLKAMYYMYIAQTRDTLGVPINEVGRPARQCPLLDPVQPGRVGADCRDARLRRRQPDRRWRVGDVPGQHAARVLAGEHQRRVVPRPYTGAPRQGTH